LESTATSHEWRIQSIWRTDEKRIRARTLEGYDRWVTSIEEPFCRPETKNHHQFDFLEVEDSNRPRDTFSSGWANQGHHQLNEILLGRICLHMAKALLGRITTIKLEVFLSLHQNRNGV
jgi:hypothetical protein